MSNFDWSILMSASDELSHQRKPCQDIVDKINLNREIKGQIRGCQIGIQKHELTYNRLNDMTNYLKYRGLKIHINPSSNNFPFDYLGIVIITDGRKVSSFTVTKDYKRKVGNVFKNEKWIIKLPTFWVGDYETNSKIDNYFHIRPYSRINESPITFEEFLKDT